MIRREAPGPAPGPAPVLALGGAPVTAPAPSAPGAPRLDRAVEAHALEGLAPAELADALNALPLDRAARELAALPFSRAARLVDRAGLARRAALFERLHARYAASLVEAMSPDQRAGLFRSLAPAERSRLAPALPPAVREDVEALLRWPAASAAGIMTTAFLAVPPSCSVGRALERLADVDDGSLAYAAVFVVEPEDGRLTAAHPVRALARADRESRMAWLEARAPMVSVAPLDSLAAVERAVRRHDLVLVPVVSEGRLLGVVTVDDVLEAAARRRDGDAHREAGLVLPDESAAGAPVALAARARRLAALAGLQLAGALALLLVLPPAARWLALALPLAVALGAAGTAAAQGAAETTRALRGMPGAPRPRVLAALLGRELAGGLVPGGAAALVLGAGMVLARGLPWIGGMLAARLPALAAPALAALALVLVPLGAALGAAAALLGRDAGGEARPVPAPALRLAIDLVGLAVVALVLRLVAGG